MLYSHKREAFAIATVSIRGTAVVSATLGACGALDACGALEFGISGRTPAARFAVVPWSATLEEVSQRSSIMLVDSIRITYSSPTAPLVVGAELPSGAICVQSRQWNFQRDSESRWLRHSKPEKLN